MLLAGYGRQMTQSTPDETPKQTPDETPDFQLAADDPMLEQIESATATSEESVPPVREPSSEESDEQG